MRIQTLFILLLLGAHLIRAEAEVPERFEPKLKEAIALLNQVKVGSEILSKAKALGIPIEGGLVSKTDVTAQRVTSQGGAHAEELKFQTRVTIALDKAPVFQALDLVHELVHATEAKNNPFDPKLTAISYVQHGIEGAGGEAQAIATECAVGKSFSSSSFKERLKADTLQLIKARCQFVWNAVPDPIRWTQSFYSLGQYYEGFIENLLSLHRDAKAENNWLVKVDSRSPKFTSAVAHKPYPLALLEEYVAITQKVCNRAKMSKIGRTLASTVALLKDRCESIGVEL